MEFEKNVKKITHSAVLQPLKLTNIIEHALGTTLGLLMFVLSLFAIGFIVYYFTGDRYFAPSIHKISVDDIETGKV